MKKTMTILTMAILTAMLGGCTGEERMTAWLMTAQDIDLGARGGVLDPNGNTELGLEVEYDRSSEIEWGPEPNYIGPYIIFWLTQDVTITDTPEPSPLKDLLEALHARPYAGMNLMGRIDSGWRDIQPNFMGGTKFTIEPESDFALNIEYKDGDNTIPGMYICTTLRF